MAQFTNLAVPYLLRAAVLGIVFIVAFFALHDEGFTPHRGANPREELRTIVAASLDHGWRNPPVRWLMLAAPFTMGTGIFAFYAMQPYLLELYGDTKAFGIAGLAAAIVAGAQIVGGVMVPLVRKMFRRRTDALLASGVLSVVALAGLAATSSFWIALVLLATWALAFAVPVPIRQAYVNGVIPSEQRATVLSFDALMSSAGGVVAQPALGRAADVWGFSASYGISALVGVAAIPFYGMARRERAASDPI